MCKTDYDSLYHDKFDTTAMNLLCINFFICVKKFKHTYNLIKYVVTEGDLTLVVNTQCNI